MNFIKYKNRKIYSPDTKRYVTLDELIDLVVTDNVNITVISHENGLDVTDEVLTSAIPTVAVISQANIRKLLNELV